MKQIAIPLAEFDLQGFIGRIFRFVKQSISDDEPGYHVHVVRNDNGYYSDERSDFKAKDLLRDIMLGTELFLPFAYSGRCDVVAMASGRKKKIYAFCPYWNNELGVAGVLVSLRDGNLVFEAGAEGWADGECPITRGSTQVADRELREFIRSFRR